MSRTAYIECTSGVSGDMLLAAMMDCGAPVEVVEKCVSDLGMKEVSLRVEDVTRGGLRAKRLHVDAAADAPARHWSDIRAMLEGSALEPDVKTRSLKAFERLAECEAALHGVSVEKVHFHELSGADTIVDIVGAFAAAKWLGIENISASAVNVGSGTVECRHGILPVPAPATAELLRGVPIYSNGEGELATPTGALLLTELASEFGPMPVMKVSAIGHGAGARECDSRPNMLRIFLGEAAWGEVVSEPVLQVQTNIDDMNPQIYPYLIERMLEAGAMDAYLEQMIMKKGRPAVKLSILCRPEQLHAIFSLLMAETTTLGARITRTERLCIERAFETVETEYGPIKIKIGVMGGAVANVMPEYEDCAAAARRACAPLASVMDAARAVAGVKWKAGEKFLKDSSE